MPDGYTKQFIFQNYSPEEIKEDKEKAKEWFNYHKQFWGDRLL